MLGIEEILAVIPPRFVLDHYWNVVRLVDFRVINLKNKKQLSVIDIKKAILNDMNESSNPFYRRICTRSINIVENIVSDLVKGELLLAKNNTFYISDSFSFFYRLLKKIRSTATRSIAWAVWYLYCNGYISFSTSELTDSISYTEQEYLNEIPYLCVWKEDRYVNLLEKIGEQLKLLEAPYASKKPVLSMTIESRLQKAFSAISKPQLLSEDVLKRIRQLEREAAERTLKRLGLEYDARNWKVNDDALDKIRAILLESSAVLWPFYGIMVSRTPYYKLQTRTFYVDIPNAIISQFLEELQFLGSIHNGNLEIYHEESLKIRDLYNNKFEEIYGKWLRFLIRRETFSNKPIGVQIRIKWKEFIQFIEDLSQRDIPLEDKYLYLLNCRAPSIRLAIKGDLERTQKDVKEICKGDIDSIRLELEYFISRIKLVRDILAKISSRRKTIPEIPSTLLYFPEMISILQAMGYLIENGAIPACYREMRKILENLSWVIFDDILLQKISALKTKRNTTVTLPRPYRYLSKEWYNWARQKKHIIGNLGQLNKKVQDMIDKIYDFSENHGYNWTKKGIGRSFFQSLSYPLFLLLTGTGLNNSRKLGDIVPSYESNLLLDLAEEDLRKLVRKLKKRRLSKSDINFIEKILKNIKSKVPVKIIPVYPSNEFVLHFVSKMFHMDLMKHYSEKSHFVHSYFTSWHIFPFSSVMEFKILNYELSKFIDMIINVLSTYSQEIFNIKINQMSS